MALRKYQFYEVTGATGHFVLSAGAVGTFKSAQTFTPEITHYISRVDLLLYRVGTVDEVTIEIRPTSEGVPAGGITAYGEALASATADVSGITTETSGTWITFTFDTPAELTVDVLYAIVAASNVNNVAVDEVRWIVDVSSAAYTVGVAYAFVEGAWNDYPTYDMPFREYGELTVAADPPPAINVSYSKKLVAVGANEFWYESEAGTMYELADANDDMDVTEGLDIFELYGKVFVVNDSNLKVADFINVRLHTLDIKPADKVYPRHGTVIAATGGAASGAQMVVDYITALDVGAYVYGKLITPDETFLDTDVCTATILVDGVSSSVSFTLDADQATGPFWYDWTVYGDDSAGYGALPNKATLGCNYCGRAVVAGNPEAPHQWYMSREGHPFDLLYAGQDAQSAVAGNNTDAGEIGDIITALIPCNDDFLIFGAINSIWFLIGNPCDGGSINEFDLTTGIYGGKSWCFGDAGNLYFWGANGLYKTTIPGKPVCISEIKLPNLVNDEAANSSTHRITLAYDRDRAGILICITKVSDGTNSNYWYDLRTEGFFPEEYPTTKAIYSAFFYEAANPTYRGLLLGGTDGYLRVFDETSENDDDTLIDSYVTFAPLPMSSDPKLTGKLTGLDIISAGGGANGSQSDSDDIDFKVFTANAAEQVIEKLYADTSPNISGTIKAPGRRRGCTIRKKVKGVYMGIRIGNDTEDETWAFEQLLYDTKNAGRLK